MKFPDEGVLIPAERAIHGSERGLWERTQALGNMTAAATYATTADVRGYGLTHRLMSHYLYNWPEGRYVELTDNEIDKVMRLSQVRTAEQEGVAYIKAAAKDAVIKDPSLIGHQREICAVWPHPKDKRLVEWKIGVSAGGHGEVELWGEGFDTENADISLGIGQFSVAVGSDTTVWRERNGHEWWAEIRHAVYIYDYYDFQKKSIFSRQMRQLELFGWARSFPVRGNYDNKRQARWEGPV